MDRYGKYLPEDPHPVVIPAFPKEAVVLVRQTEQYHTGLDYKADFTYLIFGGNDIDEQTHPKTLATQTQQLAQDISNKLGKKYELLVLSLELTPDMSPLRTLTKLRIP